MLGCRYPAISPSWRKDSDGLTVFFDYSPEIRKVIYTTNAIESLNYSLRRMLKSRGAFPNDDAISKCSIWRSTGWLKNGRCRSATGKPHSINLSSSLVIG